MDEKVLSKIRGQKILVVDDEYITYSIIKNMVQVLGIFVDYAPDGCQAVKMFEASKEFEYRMIFMDISMPNMNGYEATDLIRKTKRNDNKKTVICALTANDLVEDVQKAIICGMNNYIKKPFLREQIYEAILRAFVS